MSKTETKTVEKVDVVIKSEIQEMADVFTKALTVDNKAGTIVIEKDAYKKSLPEGLTVETVEQVRAHDAVVASAATLAVGTAANKIMKANEEIGKIAFAMPMTGRDKLKIGYDRERQVPNFTDGEPDGTRAKYGVATVGFDFVGTKTRGQMAAVKDLLSNQAMASFGNTKK